MSMRVSTIRVRMGAADAHYAGNLVNGSRMLDLFGDIATELAILSDGTVVPASCQRKIFVPHEEMLKW